MKASITRSQLAATIILLALAGKVTAQGPIHGGKSIGSTATACSTRPQNPLQDWQRLIVTMAGDVTLTEREKVAVINSFFNRLCWISDIGQWSSTDYWATPLEVLAAGGGDCEDFAIAKYFSLKAAGIAPEKLRITYASLPEHTSGHMVLLYYPSAEADPLVLDNIDQDPTRLSHRTDLQPIYSFNANSLRLEGRSGRAPVHGNIRHLKSWVAMRERLAQAPLSATLGLL